MADVIHKNEDLSELSEAEQLELVMRESKIDALSPEEQVWHRKIQNCYSYLHCKRNITHSKESKERTLYYCLKMVLQTHDIYISQIPVFFPFL